MTATPQTPAALVTAARTALARALGRSKPASAAALGRALGYDSIAPGRNVQSWLSGETVIPPPAALALQFMASGAPLPSFVLARAAKGSIGMQEASPAPIAAPSEPQASPARLTLEERRAQYHRQQELEREAERQRQIRGNELLAAMQEYVLAIGIDPAWLRRPSPNFTASSRCSAIFEHLEDAIEQLRNEAIEAAKRMREAKGAL